MTNEQKGFVLLQADALTAPTLVCESCGAVIQNYKLAWVMWPDLLKDKQAAKPILLCKTNGCVSKPPYIGYASMELRDFLVNLWRNAGMKSEKDLLEAFEFTELSEQV